MVSGKRPATSTSGRTTAKSRAKASNTNPTSSSNQQSSSSSARRVAIETSTHYSAPSSSINSTTNPQEEFATDPNFKKVQIWGNRHYHNHPMIFVKRMGKTVNFSGYSALFTASRIIHEYMKLNIDNNFEELRNFINKIQREELSSDNVAAVASNQRVEGQETNEEDDDEVVVLRGGFSSDGSR